jgi:hypothetical protein
MRCTDIWRSIVALKIMNLNKKNILFHNPTMKQFRNPHDLIKDFIDEIPMYENTKHLYNSINKDALQEYLNDTKKSYSKGQFYLGGQLLMYPDEEITLKKFDEVRDISNKRFIEYGGPSNSFEAASIKNYQNIFNDVEKIVRIYLKIGYLRELEKNQKLNTDLNTEITEFL